MFAYVFVVFICVLCFYLSHCSYWILFKLLVLSNLMHGFLQVFTWICQIWFMDFSTFLLGFVKIDFWISLRCYIDSSKLLHRFVKVVTWIYQSCSISFSVKTNCWSRQKMMQNKLMELFARLILKNWKPYFFL